MLSKVRGVRTLMVLGITGIAALAGAATAFAGATDTRNATCTFYADGGGWCSGSLRAFRTSADATAYLTFTSVLGNFAPERWIYLRFNNTFKSIQAPSTLGAPALELFDNVATAVDAHVHISWTGPVNSPKLSGLQVFNDSKLIP
jgi:hypothetical protein